MLLSPKQLASIRDATARINVWDGAVRSGKTIASLLAFVLAVAAAPEQGLIVISGKTLQAIERNVLTPLQDVALFGPAALTVKHTTGAGTAKILGRTVHLVGANDARAEEKIRGMTAYLAYVDEATLVPEAFWRQLLARLSVPGARLFATTNPDGPKHWLKTGFLDRAGELSLARFQFRLADNPSLPSDYVAALKAEYTGLWRKRFIDGAWVVASGAIFDAWNPDVHVTTDLPAITEWVSIGVDYGTRNDFAAVALGLGADQRLHIASEWRWASKDQQRQLTDAEYSRRLRSWMAEGKFGDPWVIVDPSAASFITQLNEDQLTPVRADNAVADGIRTFASLIATDRLRVHVSCDALIDELASYSWDPKQLQLGLETPLKTDDHGVDAARYAVFTTRGVWNGRLREPAEPEPPGKPELVTV